MSSNVVNVVIEVDTEKLRADFPNGIGQHQSGQDLAPYFQVLTSKANQYQDPADPTHFGVKCRVDDILRFRSIPSQVSGDSVLIIEFADRSDSRVSVNDYLAAPTFRTSYFTSDVYDNNYSSGADYVSDWQGWRMWSAHLAEAERSEPKMDIWANRSTSSLPNNHIQYTLGFRVRYPDTVLDFWFDPYIQID
jgi:hypothetical protein